MCLWKRVSRKLKDKNSLLKARLFRHSTLRNPEIEKAIIKATSHDESSIDFRHTRCVFSWIHLCDEYFQPALYVISKRLEKTHNWVVALKGLMLMHGVCCCCKLPVDTIGQLPCDLSNFQHGRSGSAKRWSFEAFIRSYYGFLEQKSMVLLHFSELLKHENKTKKHLILQDLVCLEKLQCLLDTLLQIKPQNAANSSMLVLEAMDCLVVESFDIYERICDGIVCVLVNIYQEGITESKKLMTILETTMVQGEKLSEYLDFCKQMGVINASGCAKIEHIQETDIQDLESLIKDPFDQSEEMKYVVLEKETMTKRHESDDSRIGSCLMKMI